MQALQSIKPKPQIFNWTDAPPQGEASAIAPGLWLLPVPLDSTLDHVNLYVLADADGWTLVDTGINTPLCRQALESAFSREPLKQFPITRVISTHFHPDHIGLAGWLCQQGAELWTSRTCWMQTRLLTVDDRPGPLEHELHFVRKAGMQGLEFEAFRRRPHNNYRQTVLPLPDTYHRLTEGDRLTIGDRTWTVHLGYGHAVEHVTLWADDGHVITGDQVLPGISSNISVLSSEPEEDVLSEWIESCKRFAQLASDEMLCLPGHNLPFYGIGKRCHQLIHSHQLALARLLQYLQQPRTVLDCLEVIYRRKLRPDERSLLIAEAFGYLNHLHKKNMVEKTINFEGAYLWFKR